MTIQPISLPILQPPRDNLIQALSGQLPVLRERDLVVITSKVVAIHQGRCRLISQVPDKDTLILEEAERYLPRSSNKWRSLITLKGHTLVSGAGIDASNGNGYYILWPADPNSFAVVLWQHLRQKHQLRDLGIIITDSHSTPLRLGAMGIAIGFYGFHPLKDYRGKPDLFGRPLKIEQANLLDALAAAAVLVMGEADERTPVAMIRDVAGLEFTDQPTQAEIFVDPDDDLYAPIYQVFHHSGDKS